MTDWNEQSAPNNNLGSTTLKKSQPTGNKSKADSPKDKQEKHDQQ